MQRCRNMEQDYFQGVPGADDANFDYPTQYLGIPVDHMLKPKYIHLIILYEYKE